MFKNKDAFTYSHRIVFGFATCTSASNFILNDPLYFYFALKKQRYDKQ